MLDRQYSTQDRKVLTGPTSSPHGLRETSTSTTGLWPCTLTLVLSPDLLGAIADSSGAVDGIRPIVGLVLLLFLLHLDDAIAGVTYEESIHL